MEEKNKIVFLPHTIYKISPLDELMTFENGKIFKALVKNIEGYIFKLGKAVNDFLNKYKMCKPKKIDKFDN